ncbi:hypothetical protein C265_07054 [Cupriavidus sp. GA3-3]|uniref:hypothetical protein n=1 Tax=Cupriavidus TaxID=106589 RepID=UPI0003313E2F|nr:hypothetical protein [Cupriavidus sp. GA3-3]EON20709.1 hypothetical protein C265_07054 [Cupriavidus sp. GA3-3]
MKPRPAPEDAPWWRADAAICKSDQRSKLVSSIAMLVRETCDFGQKFPTGWSAGVRSAWPYGPFDKSGLSFGAAISHSSAV